MQNLPKIFPEKEEIILDPLVTKSPEESSIARNNFMLIKGRKAFRTLRNLLGEKTILEDQQRLKDCYRMMVCLEKEMQTLPEGLLECLKSNDPGIVKKGFLYCLNKKIPCFEILREKLESMNQPILRAYFIRLMAQFWPAYHRDIFTFFSDEDNRVRLTAMRELAASAGVDNSLYFPIFVWYSFQSDESLSQESQRLLKELPEKTFCMLQDELTRSPNKERNRVARECLHIHQDRGRAREGVSSTCDVDNVNLRTRPETVPSLKRLKQLAINLDVDKSDYFLQFLSHENPEFVETAILALSKNRRIYEDNFTIVQRTLVKMSHHSALAQNRKALAIIGFLEDVRFIDLVSFTIYKLADKPILLHHLIDRTLGYWATKSEALNEVLLEFQRSHEDFENWDAEHIQDEVMDGWDLLSQLKESLTSTDEGSMRRDLERLSPSLSGLDSKELLKLLRLTLKRPLSTEITCLILEKFGLFAYRYEFEFLYPYLDHKEGEVVASVVKALGEQNDLRVLNRVLKAVQEDLTLPHNTKILEYGFSLLKRMRPESALVALQSLAEGNANNRKLFYREITQWEQPPTELKTYLMDRLRAENSEQFIECVFGFFKEHGNRWDISLMEKNRSECVEKKKAQLFQTLIDIILRKRET
ncbi:hypothetical protein HOF92_11165 [bacterium]|jgi:hypothetical protein|nr:hypothetical protein [bacterium]